MRDKEIIVYRIKKKKINNNFINSNYNTFSRGFSLVYM